jgi:hypothetical protein
VACGQRTLVALDPLHVVAVGHLALHAHLGALLGRVILDGPEEGGGRLVLRGRADGPTQRERRQKTVSDPSHLRLTLFREYYRKRPWIMCRTGPFRHPKNGLPPPPSAGSDKAARCGLFRIFDGV